ncbi:helix-turn-helix domain-containing protein [Parabacteroides goldsteinii]|uniref:helix-turn-helix domain-containing protein n=1 Tax=Parabacteroides goldsteinii TaxID=328812 RepID=UPI001D9D1483|nr:helix-turn-helix domain-containing protein [Parabacteroides goldsteinii]MBS6574793.1 helix-turn-helix domain-containing protein [Parabacteroides goldsteinii]
MELITKEDCFELLQGLDDLTKKIEQVISNNKPSINGERYLGGTEVCKLFNITKRTLHEYRNMRQIPYIHIYGKILYKESDLLRLLKENYINTISCI